METINEVVLVNEQDIAVGRMNKLQAHQEGHLHRAFSVFIFNNKNELLLQKRAIDKYHSGGLWTNTCCSHPADGEDPKTSAERRLQEEMGFTVPLKFFKSFTYRADLENGLIEHEFDHVFIGYYNGDAKPDPAEVVEWKYIGVDDLLLDMKADPSGYTAWLNIIMPEVWAYISQ